jgi:hypothetical protein
MMIDSQTPIQFWGETVNTAVYLHQRSPNEGLKRNDSDGYQAPNETPYEMLHGFAKLTHDMTSNTISYQAPQASSNQYFNTVVKIWKGRTV